MDPNLQYYKRVMGCIGGTMLIFLGLFYAFSTGIGFFTILLELIPMSSVAYNVIYQTVYAAGYLLVFMLPVAFLRKMLRKRGYVVQPMMLQPRISPVLPLAVFAGITICFSAAEINSFVVNLIGYGDFMEEITAESMGSMTSYELVLYFIVISIVPGFCEEFLFRGAILANCRPFGRANAIFISATLFSLMHQNAAQILYTFAAGIVLGLLYEYTGSIWNCTLLHILNNFISVVQSAIIYKLGETDYAVAVLYLIETLIYLIGIISIVILVTRYFSPKQQAREGAFERSLPASDEYATHPVRGKQALRGFFRPTMIVFVVLATLDIILLVALSLLF